MDDFKEGQLPMVGIKCEAAWNIQEGFSIIHYEWTKGVFKGGYNSKIWFGTDDHKEVIVPAHDIKFRPIQSAKEKAIDALQECIIGAKSVHSLSVAKALHDANYHNQKKVKALEFEMFSAFINEYVNGQSEFNLYKMLIKEGYIIEAKEDE